MMTAPESDMNVINDDPSGVISQICESTPPDERWRILILECDIKREELRRMLDLNENVAVNLLLEHLEEIDCREKELLLRNYQPLMKSKTQIDLQNCSFQPDRRLLLFCAYDIVDAVPINRRDFWWKIGIESPERLPHDTIVHRREFEGVLDWWWKNQAERRFNELVGLLRVANQSAGQRDTVRQTRTSPDVPTSEITSLIRCDFRSET